MLKPGSSYQFSLLISILGHDIGKHVGDPTPVVLTKNNAEWTIWLAEVQRFHFDQPHLDPFRC